jgi:hypothetical protein
MALNELLQFAVRRACAELGMPKWPLLRANIINQGYDSQKVDLEKSAITNYCIELVSHNLQDSPGQTPPPSPSGGKNIQLHVTNPLSGLTSDNNSADTVDLDVDDTDDVSSSRFLSFFLV